jgi:asparagine synthase (glutamine-hydrolysing)
VDACSVIQQMTDRLAHRGPDDSGVWSDPARGIWLGHRRLSVLDLSREGHQPMVSETGRYVLVYNGEVYNHLPLRQEVGGATWRGHSDTETILAAVERWGIESAVTKFVGMFAFALWDREVNELWLGRDRVGVKPMYYAWTASGLLFGSELTALRMHPLFCSEIDRVGLQLLVRYSSVPAPHTIFRDAFKLRPGTLLRVSLPHRDAVEELTYWSVSEVARNGQECQFSGSREDAVDRLEELLLEAVQMRMLSDVELGAFLSGGVDSSTVVALMQARSGRPVRTFSIGSPDASFDEAASARQVALHLGTHHTELVIDAADALEVVPLLATLYDEPFADSSQIPTYLLSKLARQNVTVALSGDGGDELFGGYNRHVWAGRVWTITRRLPLWLRRAAGRTLTAVAPGTYDCWFVQAGRVLPRPLRHRLPGYKLHKLASVLDCSSPLQLYERLAAQWPHTAQPVIGGPQHMGLREGVNLAEFPSQMMLMDMERYLPDDILTKVDRASMAVGLEVRVPILDHRVVEFAWQLPLRYKICEGQSKWVLRQVLHRYVPLKLVDRPKAGFGIPLGSWLRGPLRDWAEDLLDEERLTDEGYFDPGPIREAWQQHLAGTHSWEYALWTVLMFQAWTTAASAPRMTAT